MLSLFIPMLGCAAAGEAQRPAPEAQPALAPNAEASAVEVPAQESDVPKTPTTVSCNLVVNPDELKLSVASVSLSEEELEKLGGKWPNKQGKHDVEGLQKWLVSLKTRYPGSNTITVVPADEVNYQDLIHVLDATRERNTNKTNARGEQVFEELFPVTIFSRLVKAEEGAGQDGEGDDLEFDEGEAPQE